MILSDSTAQPRDEDPESHWTHSAYRKSLWAFVVYREIVNVWRQWEEREERASF